MPRHASGWWIDLAATVQDQSAPSDEGWGQVAGHVAVCLWQHRNQLIPAPWRGREAVLLDRQGRYSNFLVVNPACPARTVPEFIAYAKANPDGVNVASAGNGTSQHVAAELFNMMAGATMRHVPYRGSAMALTDLLGGQVQAMFAPVAASIKYVTSNKLRSIRQPRS